MEIVKSTMTPEEILEANTQSINKIRALMGRRFGHRRQKSTTYGQKSGEGPTWGKKSATYEATLPDGQVVRKRSFYVFQDQAWLAIYQHDNKWHVAGVCERLEDGKPVFRDGSVATYSPVVEARRIK